MLTQKIQAQTNASQPDTILKPGDPVPSLGVFVYPDRYKFLITDEKKTDLFEHSLDSTAVCPSAIPTVSLFSSTGYGFVVTIGIAAFAIGWYFAEHH